MANATAETLYRIAANKAENGFGWDALAAHMAADALAITAEMEKAPQALLDISPLRSLDLPENALPAVAEAFRRRLLHGLDNWGIAGAVSEALPAITLADAPLDSAEAGAFARGWLGGRDLQAFGAVEAARSVRLAALAGRLYAAGEYPAAGRSASAADRATVAAHYGAEAAAVGDTHLAALRTALLLAEDIIEAEGTASEVAAAGRQARAAHDAANFTDKPIHWQPISYLS